jgi:hypothetical protein
MYRYPLRVEAHRDEPLSRWLWLVKWLLLIPHYVVLLFLYAGMVVLTLVAYLAVLFTGRYPHSIAAYNLGVLRWNWRVCYYGYQVLGTDRYPPFTLADVPDYPARLRLDEPPRPPRWLPLVAWLFAIPHVLIVLALSGAIAWQGDIVPGGRTAVPLGVVTVGILIAGFGLLFAGRYPRGVYDLLVGIGRWALRATSYLALLTPRYPPFRLDQGDHEPEDDGPPPVPARVTTAAAPRGGVAGPVTALVAGVFLLAPATGLTIGGGALLALDSARDSAGYVSSPAVSVQTSTAAITAEGITLQAGDLWTRGLSDIGGVRISVTGNPATPLFVGIAAESDVDAWLSGVAHDELTKVSRGTGTYQRAPGGRSPAAAPDAQDFWLATGAGTGAATVTWKATAGDFAVVLANADGSTGVVADVRAATQVPDLTGLGAGLLTTGILLGLAAIALIVLGGVGLGRRHGGTPPPPGPPPGPPVAGPPPVYATTPE